MDVIVSFFSWIMELGHRLIPNYWIDIIIFTAITKVLQFPLTLWCHINSLKMVSLMPKTNELKIKFYGDEEKIGEETAALYKKEHYHPLLSLLPLGVQIVVLMGFVRVIHSITDGDVTALLAKIPVRDGGVAWVMPLMAAGAAWFLGYCQNRINPLQHEQTRCQQMITNGISIAISLFLGCYVAMGVGLYWAASNVFSILTQLWCNVTIRPNSRIDYVALYRSRKELDELKAKTKIAVSPDDRKREKADYKRFFSIDNKHLVFYSEGSGFYKYFESLIDWLLKHSNITVHYVTNDPNDQIFTIANQEPRIKPYYIGTVKIIPLMMKMDADMVVMTTPDLGKYQIKRSFVRKDVEYLYMTHGVSSVHLCLRQGAFDNYDTIFVVGPYQVDEHRKTEELYHLRAKNLVRSGYMLLDSLFRQYELDRLKIEERKRSAKPKILIAPSYHEGNILESCLDELLAQCCSPDRLVVVRPHPRFISHNAGLMQNILNRHRDMPADQLVFEMDFTSNSSIYESDIVISDWSSISYEFSFTTKRPCIIIDTPMKVINPEWKKLGIEPADIWMRDGVGRLVRMAEIGEISVLITEMLTCPEKYAVKIQKLMETSLYNPGHASEIAGRYILNSLVNRSQKQ